MNAEEGIAVGVRRRLSQGADCGLAHQARPRLTTAVAHPAVDVSSLEGDEGGWRRRGPQPGSSTGIGEETLAMSLFFKSFAGRSSVLWSP